MSRSPRRAASSVTPGEIESYLGLLYGLPAGPSPPQRDPGQRASERRDRRRRRAAGHRRGDITTAVHSFLHPVVRDAQAVSNQFGSSRRRRKKKPKVHKLPKTQISVLVLNAGTVTGEAANTHVPAHEERLRDEDAPAVDQPRTRRSCSATRSSTTTRRRRTRRRPRRSSQPLFGAAHGASSR